MLLALLLALQGCPLPLDFDTVPILLTGDPEPLEDLGGQAVFVATTAAHGRELWVSDGTEAGTGVLFEPQPGPVSSNVFLRGQNNGLLYFLASDSLGVELWVTDGSAAGTGRLADIMPGPGGSQPTNVSPAGALTFFSAEDAVHGREFWVTDGTPAGTHLVTDHVPGVGNGAMPVLAAGNGVALGSGPTPGSNKQQPHYITANSVTALGDLSPGSLQSKVTRAGVVPGTTRIVIGVSDTTPKLYATTGTPASTRWIVDVEVDSEFVETGLTTPGAELFFIAETATGGRALWHTDGTKNGTGKLMDFALFEDELVSLEAAVHFGGEFYFMAQSDAHGREIWKTDGTAAGTSELIDWLPGTDGIYLQAAVEHGGELYLFLFDDQAVRVDIVATGGTAATTRLVASVANVAVATAEAAADGIYFTAGNFGAERLWFLDGATEVVALVDPTIMDNDEQPVPVAGGVLYRHDAVGIGSEVWKATGGAAELVADLEPLTPTAGTKAQYVTPVFGRELWMMIRDTPTGTEPARLVPGGMPEVLPVLPKANMSTDPHFTGFWTGSETRVAFVAPGSQSSSYVLWITDGTVAGTVETSVVVEVTNVQLAPLGAGLVFAGEGDGAGRELWFTDGTLAGTTRLADIAPGPIAEGKPTDFVGVGERVFFVANDGVHDVELWVTDGTTAGTAMVVDLNPAGTSFPVGLVRVQDRLAFYASATGGWSNHDLWVTDGTAAGTTKVSELELSPIDLEPPLSMGGSVYFFANLDAAGGELWRSDLTAAGTSLVADLNPAGDLVASLELAADGRVWFTVHGGATPGLYVTDGTPAGTQLVPGTAGATPVVGVAAGGGVYFTGHAGPGTLAFTDGNAVTTFCTETADGGFENSDVGSLSLIGGDLYMRAELVNSGEEFAVLPNPGAHAVDLGLGRSSLVLEADSPQLGTLASVHAIGSPPTKTSVLAMSKALDEPWAFAPYGDQAVWLSPQSFVALGVFSVGSWTKQVALPLEPALVGYALNVQAVSVDSQDGSDPELSNGLRLVLGT